MEAFIFTHFEPENQQIAIRGLEKMINRFTKENKSGIYDELQLYNLVNDFNKKQTSVSIEITPEFVNLIQYFPSVLYNSVNLRKIKKINMTKALSLEGDDFYKQDKFTQDIVNRTIWWFIALCAEVNWKMVKLFVQHPENLREKKYSRCEFLNLYNIKILL